MKYCKKCGVLYSTEVCPKCGITVPEETDQKQAEELTEEEKRQRKKNWIQLLIGIPAFIAAVYLIIWAYTAIAK